MAKRRQYTIQAEQERFRIARKITREHGLTWSEMVKLTGMRLSENTLFKLENGVDAEEFASLVL